MKKYVQNIILLESLHFCIKIYLNSLSIICNGKLFRNNVKIKTLSAAIQVLGTLNLYRYIYPKYFMCSVTLPVYLSWTLYKNSTYSSIFILKSCENITFIGIVIQKTMVHVYLSWKLNAHSNCTSIFVLKLHTYSNSTNIFVLNPLCVQYLYQYIYPKKLWKPNFYQHSYSENCRTCIFVLKTLCEKFGIGNKLF